MLAMGGKLVATGFAVGLVGRFILGSDRGLVNEMLNVPGRHKAWPAEYRCAEHHFLESFGMLLRKISDQELADVIAQLEQQFGRPPSDIEAIA
jgi:hypothetical protein